MKEPGPVVRLPVDGFLMNAPPLPVPQGKSMAGESPEEDRSRRSHHERPPPIVQPEKQAAEAYGSVTFEDLSDGIHELELTDLADNGAVGGDSPISVSVTGGDTNLCTFSVT